MASSPFSAPFCTPSPSNVVLSSFSSSSDMKEVSSVTAPTADQLVMKTILVRPEILDMISGISCSICQEALCEPMETKCEHSYCKSCINRAIELHDRCPECRTDNIKSTLRPSAEANPGTFRRIFGSLKVKCPLHIQQGCTWTGDFSSIYDHITRCEYHPIKCTNNGCSQWFLRRDISTHQTQQCEYRLVSCGECHKQVVFKTMAHHLINACDATMIPCTKYYTGDGCGIMIRRDQRNKHQNTCESRHVACELSEVGCYHRASAKNMAVHQTTGAHDHVKLLQAQINTLKIRMDEMKKKEPEIYLLSKASESKVDTYAFSVLLRGAWHQLPNKLHPSIGVPVAMGKCCSTDVSVVFKQDTSNHMHLYHGDTRTSNYMVRYADLGKGLRDYSNIGFTVAIKADKNATMVVDRRYRGVWVLYPSSSRTPCTYQFRTSATNGATKIVSFPSLPAALGDEFKVISTTDALVAIAINRPAATKVEVYIYRYDSTIESQSGEWTSVVLPIVDKLCGIQCTDTHTTFTSAERSWLIKVTDILSTSIPHIRSVSSTGFAFANNDKISDMLILTDDLIVYRDYEQFVPPPIAHTAKSIFAVA